MNIDIQQQVNQESAVRMAASPLADLRSLIADGFTQGIVAGLPRIRADLQARLAKCSDDEEKRVLHYAVRILSGRQEQLAGQLDRRLRRRFDVRLDCPDDAASHTGRFSTAALTLFAELGMLEEFDLEQCVDELREQCRPQLQSLTAHLRKVLCCGSLPEAHNPAFPRVMLRALQDALAHAGCDARARRVAFRACRPLLPPIIIAIYQRANAMFANLERGGLGGFDGRYARARLMASASAAGRH